MSLQEKIKQLSEIRSDDVPIISLYVHYSHREAREIEKIRIFLKNVSKSIENQGYGKELESDLKEIHNRLENHIRPTTHGVAFFYCSSIGLKSEIQTWVPLRSQWTLSSSPNLRQLARILDDYEHSLAVVVNSEKARIIQITPEATAEESMITEGFPGRHDQGGWSQARFQRHVEEHLMRHLKRAAEAVVRDWDEHHYTTAVLGGQDHITAQFIKLLPKRITQTVAGTLNLDISDSQENLVHSVVHLIREVEERRAGEELIRLQSSGNLLEGWDNVVPAINQSRISTLFIKAGDTKPGWVCPVCDLLGEKVPLGCPICGGSVVTADLVDASVAKVERDGGRIEICTKLDNMDVAGRMRF